jgi:hypothetical protein
MKIQILPEADLDLLAGAAFYEEQRPGLGNYFLDCLEADINQLATLAGIHERVQGYHRLLSKKFPYAIFYLVEGEYAKVRAVLDCRRDPEWTKDRLV